MQFPTAKQLLLESVWFAVVGLITQAMVLNWTRFFDFQTSRRLPEQILKVLWFLNLGVNTENACTVTQTLTFNKVTQATITNHWASFGISRNLKQSPFDLKFGTQLQDGLHRQGQPDCY